MVGRSHSVSRLLVVLGGLVGTFALGVLGASGAAAQAAPEGTVVFGGFTVFTGPEGSGVSIEGDGTSLEVFGVSTSTATSSSFEGVLELEDCCVEVEAVGAGGSGPGFSFLVGAIDIVGAGVEVSELFVETCGPGGSGSLAAAGPAPGLAAAQTCPPPLPPAPDDSLPPPARDDGPPPDLDKTPPAPDTTPPAPDTTPPAPDTPPPAPDTPPPAPDTPPPAPAPVVVPGTGELTPPVAAETALPATADIPTATAAPEGPLPTPDAPAPAPSAPFAVALLAGPAVPSLPAAVVAPAPTPAPVAPAIAPPAPVAPAIDPPAPAVPPAAVTPPPPEPPSVAAPPPPGPGPAPSVGRITLTAVNEDGRATGPPGVGVTLAGSGFPISSPERAAPRALAQSSSCRTVFFHLDGVRIGSTQPDSDGNVRRTGLSIPGDVAPGTHAITASCRSAGVPVLVATVFEVTDASLHRSAFATALHRPDHVDFGLNSLLLSALGALAMMVLIAFPAELFNTTLEANYDEVRGWFGLRPRPPSAGTGVSNVAVFLLFLALSGPMWFAMQSSSALDMTTVLAAAGLSIATAIVILGSDLPTYLHLRRRYGERASVVALPGTLIVAVACVLLSRAVRFEPGYFYGLVGGLAFSRLLRKETSGRLAAGSVVIMVGLSFASWLALVPVARMADAPDPGAWPILVEGVLGGIFWVALDSLVIALLPLRLLTGSKVFAWRRLRWAALYGVTLFAFIHILLRPGTGYVSDTSRSPTVVVVVLFVAFAVLSFAFWGYFRFRSPHPQDKVTPAVS